MNTRKKWKPTTKQLESAWKWKKRGKTNKEIAEKLGSTLGKYQKALSDFRSHFTRKKKEERNSTVRSTLLHKKNMAEVAASKGRNYKAGERKLKVSDIDLDVLRSYVICGFNRDKIAGLMGVTRKTLWGYAKTFPDIQFILDNAQKEATKGVMQSLLKATQGGVIEDEHVSNYLGEITKTKYKKAIPANVTAMKYWLTNTIGWGSEPKSEKSNNKGTIIRMLDNMANHEEGVGPVDKEK